MAGRSEERDIIDASSAHRLHRQPQPGDQPTSSTSIAHVATVAGRPIPLARLEERVARIRRGPGGRHFPPEGGPEWVRLRRWLVQDLVREEILAHETSASGLAPEDLFQRVTADVSLAESDVRGYYRRNADRYRRPEVRRVLHALLADEPAARGLADALEAADEDRVHGRARTPDRARRPVLTSWELRRGDFSGPFEDAVFAAAEDQVVGPITSEHGWHVARVEGIVPARDIPFAQVSAAIRAELLDTARARTFGEWLDGRRKALAVIEPAYEHPSHPLHGSPRHRH